MDQCVVWVHGIGPTEAGYSDSWTQTYNECLNLPTTHYIEVLWSDVYSSATILGKPVEVVSPGAAVEVDSKKNSLASS